MTPRSDDELMAAYTAGDSAAFGELFTRYAPLLKAMLMRRLRSSSQAEDLVQQTFLQVHRARLDFFPGAKVRPWLFTICFNLLRSQLRRDGRSPFSDVETVGRVEANQLHLQELREFRQLLDDLPTPQRQVLELHWFDGLSFAEIAEQLGASVSAVKVRAHRGYNLLRARLKEDS
ncbi:MAG: hypothetical protein RJA70_2853 [Pseudomonadota bacterium]|jgi:RNA polymerase sigma-70 factor (ECF subfamily)